MSVLRASEIVAGLHDKNGDEIVRRVRGLDAPHAVADRLVEVTASLAKAPAKRATWRVATGLSTLAAAVLGARALGDLASLAPGASSPVTYLPLVAVVLVIVGFLLPRWRGRRVERDAREQEARAVLVALSRDGVSGVDALEIAAWVADVPRASLERRFDARQLGQNLAIAAVTDPPPERRRVPATSTFFIGAAAVWTVLCFWGLYFGLVGATAFVEVW
ncbi:MAG: hypothetical protein RIT81_00660 [Deltaproteobacteria bacterium]